MLSYVLTVPGSEISLKKIRSTTGTFHSKMGTIKDRNSMDLRGAEHIKKRWREYTELYRKGLNDPDTHSGEIVTERYAWGGI